MPNLGVQELLIIFLIVLLLFGAKKIPDIAQGLGRGIRDFRRAMKDTSDEISKATKVDEPSAPPLTSSQPTQSSPSDRQTEPTNREKKE